MARTADEGVNVMGCAVDRHTRDLTADQPRQKRPSEVLYVLRLASSLRRQRNRQSRSRGNAARRSPGAWSGHLGDLVEMVPPLVGNRSDAEDAAMEAVTNCWREVEEGRVDAIRDRPMYLRVAAWRAATTITRRRGWRREVPLKAAHEPPAPRGWRPDAAMERAELIREVRSAVQKLPKGYGEATVLFYIEDLSRGQIAALLGVSLDTVRGWLQRARPLMRSALGGSPKRPE